MPTVEERLTHVEQLLNATVDANLTHIDLRNALNQGNAEEEIQKLKLQVATLEIQCRDLLSMYTHLKGEDGIHAAKIAILAEALLKK